MTEFVTRSLQRELEDKADTSNLTVDKIQEQSKLIAEQIEALEKKRRDGARLLGVARDRLEGKTMSKHWVRSAKESTPRDTIRALRNPLQDLLQWETRSDRMAECQEIGLVTFMFFFELLFSYVSLAISFYVSFTNSFSITHSLSCRLPKTIKTKEKQDFDSTNTGTV